MESTLNESNFNRSHGQRRLHAVESLNNLNEQDVCGPPPQQPAVRQESSSSAGHLVMRNGRKCQSWFLVVLLISLIVSLTLVSFVIILVVHTGGKMDEVSRKIVLERKSIDDLKKLNDLILQCINQTELMEYMGNFNTVEETVSFFPYQPSAELPHLENRTQLQGDTITLLSVQERPQHHSDWPRGISVD